MGVENYIGSAGFAGELGLGGRGNGGDDAGADARGHLGEQQAYAARAGMNQCRVSCLERECGIGEVMGGHALKHGRGGLFGRKAGRRLDQLDGGHKSVLGVAAHYGNRGDQIACFESGDAGAEFLYGSRCFAAGGEGK